MTVSARVDYACRAALELAKCFDSGLPVPLRQMTEQQDIPAQFLSQILLQLKTAGLVTSTRGASGGYRLSKSPTEISLWDIVVAIEGSPTADDTSNCSTLTRCLQETWHQLASQRQQRLEETTLDVVLDQARSDSKSMYYI